MFSKDIIKSCIVLYNKLKIDGIIGKKLITLQILLYTSNKIIRLKI